MHLRRTIATLAVPVIVLTIPACGSSGSNTKAGDASSTTSKSANGDTPGKSDTSDTESAPGKNPGKATVSNETAAPDKTVIFTADKTFAPNKLQVSPGEVFSFKSADDANAAAVTFDGNDKYTITSGLVESFTLTTPGTYTVTDNMSNATMTVVVKG